MIKRETAICLRKAHDYFRLGLSYDDRGCYAQAISAYRKALRFNPRDANTLLNLGVAYYTMKRYAMAVQWFQKVVLFYPCDFEGHYNLGLAHYALQDFGRAVGAFQESVRLRRAEAEAHYNLGRAYYATGRYRNALKCFQRAIALKPAYEGELFSAHARFNLGITYLVLNQPGKVLREYKQLQRLSDPSLARELLGWMQRNGVFPKP